MLFIWCRCELVSHTHTEAISVIMHFGHRVAARYEFEICSQTDMYFIRRVNMSKNMFFLLVVEKAMVSHWSISLSLSLGGRDPLVLITHCDRLLWGGELSHQPVGQNHTGQDGWVSLAGPH